MDQVEEVKRKTDIVAVVSEYLALKKAGRHFKGLCPFHAEKTPSFIVNDELGIYKCFGCGKGGDVISFVMEMEGLEFIETLEKLASKAGVKIEKRHTEETSEKQQLLDIHSLASSYYHFLLTKHQTGEEAREYLAERGIKQKLIDNFNLGFSLPEWDGLTEYLLKKKGYKREVLVKSGLAVEGNRGIYDRFRGRVMFPLLDTGGRVVGFSGRVIPGISQNEDAKYINSPETLIYHKSQLLFGLSQARQAIREKNGVVVVEGELDMISSFAAGVTETVAIKGSALTEEMIETLARLCSTVILALDADEAGETAMKRSIELAEKRGLNIKMASWSEGKDPDEVARRSPKKWRLAVDKALEVYEFFMKRALAKYGTDSAGSIKRVSVEVVPYLSKIENSVVREVWARRLSEKLGVDKERVWEEIEKVRGGRIVNEKEEDKGPTEPVEEGMVRVEKMEKRLLSLLLGADLKTVKRVQKMLIGLRLYGSAGKVLAEVFVRESEIKPDEFIKNLPSEIRGVAEEVYLGEDDADSSSEKQVVRVGVELGRELLREERLRLSGQVSVSEARGDLAETETLSKQLVELNQIERRFQE
ncbi:DNA primase [Candidatus Collierbacteria bacterium]|nr:DNA primase [Candidatus Collierbacteria bacterium]